MAHSNSTVAQPPLQIPGYRLIELLYETAGIAVYRAFQSNSGPSTARPVVIKFLRQAYPSCSDLAKFRHQYAIAQSLPIPGIVRPLKLEPWQNGYALVMEDFGGISLQQYVQSHPLSLPEALPKALDIAIQIAQILHDLAQHQLVHKDIKPAHILIQPETQAIKLIDFSIASLLPKETQDLQSPQTLEGTLAYLAPEQTGRMNRGIDYRADFYAFGVTLYELLTGALPFTATEALALVHAHIAQRPVPPHQLNPSIPAAVSVIILKLMAKNAEDRYQSALGLKHDLEKCLKQWQATRNIALFELGEKDWCDRFHIPEKLYGRDIEIHALLSAFERTAAGTAEMMLVAGHSGIGKTVVINEVHKPVTQRQGYFSKGKFDQFNRDIPFSGFIQAFRSLIEQILGESDQALAQWKANILKAVGENAQVILEVLPELAHIIGAQPAVPDLSGTAAQNRFNLVFAQFIGVFTQPVHPLVIFLDDLQWADLSSLQLLERLLDDAKKTLLILGAYRDNEIFPAHPLMLSLAKIAERGQPLQTLTLQPLSADAIAQLCADTLSCSIDLARPLSQWVYQKTQGNPFFTSQFLLGLYGGGYLFFDAQAGHWQCNLAQIKQLALSPDVVTFVVDRLQQLPAATQSVLHLAACIGNQFDLETLAMTCDRPQESVAADLWAALKAGFILPSSETYKFFQGSFQSSHQQTNEHSAVNSSTAVGYRFLHDRVQQAAYALMDLEQQAKSHYQIGQRLKKQLFSDPQQLTARPIAGEKIFAVVTQLNYARALITPATEKSELAELNLMAAQKARAATAYQAAQQYVEIGLNLLGENAWQQQYPLTLALYRLATELAALQGNLVKMEDLAQAAITHTQSLLDQVDIQLTRIQANIAQQHLTEAIAIGEQMLQALGICFPSTPSAEDIQGAIFELNQLIGDRNIEDFANLPIMTQPEKIAAVQVASSIISAAFMSASPLYPLLIIAAVKISFEYGNTEASALAYASYSVLLCNFMQAVETGVQFSQLALNVIDKLEAKAAKPAVLSTVSLFSVHRNAHIKTTLAYFEQGFAAALAVGNMEFAGYCAGGIGLNSFLSGQPLVPLEQETRAYAQSFMQLNHPALADYCRNHWQTALNLIKVSDQPSVLTGEALQEDILLPILKAASATSALFFTYSYKLILAYLFNETTAAQAYADEVRQSLTGGIGSVLEPVFYFYDSLAALDRYHREPSAKLLQQVDHNQQQLQQQWARHAPMNYQHKADLVEAEKYRVLNQKAAALDYYDRAIAGAKANGFIQEEAIANELAAQFYLDWGKDLLAASYLQAAYYGYSYWGANAKVTQLEARYPQLLMPLLQGASRQTSAQTISQKISGSNNLTSTTAIGSTSASVWLDFPAVIKAAQAISQEVELESLLATLMQIVIANAGAQSGHLLLYQEEQWQVVVKADSTKIEPLNIPLQQYSNLSQRLIYSVARTQETAVFENLSAELQFVSEAYITRHQPKSALCLPISRQGTLVGMLYLENNITVGAFTRDRIEILQLITSQAAISIENARLYQKNESYSITLEAEVALKTKALNQKADALEHILKELRRTQAQLIHTEKMSSLGQMVAGIAHEINNPVTFIQGNLACTAEYFEDLISLLMLYQQTYPQPSAAIEAKQAEIELNFLLEDVSEILKSMMAGSDRIAQIVLSLRNFSRLDESSVKAVDLHSGLESTLEILHNRLQASDQQPEVNVIKAYGNLPLVTCEASQINQVFLNVLSNAIDAIREQPTAKAEIQIQTDTISQGETQKVRIAIANTGSPIPTDIQTRIFDPFFTTKPVGSGSGLGLSVSYSIIQRHGGTISVKSSPPQETEFEILLPVLTLQSST